MESVDATRAATRVSAPPLRGQVHSPVRRDVNELDAARRHGVSEEPRCVRSATLALCATLAKAMDVCQVHTSAHIHLNTCTRRRRLTRCRLHTRVASSAAQQDVVSVPTSEYQVSHRQGFPRGGCQYAQHRPQCPPSAWTDVGATPARLCRVVARRPDSCGRGAEAAADDLLPRLAQRPGERQRPGGGGAGRAWRQACCPLRHVSAPPPRAPCLDSTPLPGQLTP